MPGSRVEIFQLITLAGLPWEWTKRETGQRVTHRSCAMLPRLTWSAPYCELDCHAVCTWKLRNLPLSWFVHERIRYNLINQRVLKIKRGLHVVFLHVKMLDSAPFTGLPWNNASFLRRHFAQEDFRKSPPFRKYAMKLCIIQCYNNYLMHEIMEFCVTSPLVLENWEQKYCQTLGNKPNHSHRVPRGRLFKGKCKLFNSLFQSVYLVFPKSLFRLADLFAVRYLRVVCNEDKCIVVTQRGRHSRHLACLRSHVLRAYCNFESKHANSITLFERRPNKNLNHDMGANIRHFRKLCSEYT